MTNAKRKEDLPTHIRLGFHRMTASEMADAIRRMLDARPTVPFIGLQPGRVYHLRRNYGGDEVFECARMLPSGKQAVVRRAARGGAPSAFTDEDRIYAGSHSGSKFFELDADLVSLLGVTHEQAVRDALALGLDVPPRVRVEHPELFTEIPERFVTDLGEGYLLEHRFRSAAERVREALSPTSGSKWPDRYVSAASVDKWIAKAHAELARHRAAFLPRIAEGRCTDEDLEQQEREFFDIIDFCRWLRPLVDVGGVFHVEDGS